MRKNVLLYFNFKLKIEWHFRCTDSDYLVRISQLQYRNENQNIPNFIFQLVKKNRNGTLGWLL